MTTTGLDTSSSEMQERIARIAEQSNLSPISDDKQFPTLRTFLAIYLKAKHDCYIDDMEGAKYLHRWLTSDGKLRYNTSIEPTLLKVPPLCCSYDMLKLAEIVANPRETTATLKAIARIYTEVVTNDNLR